MTSSTSGNIMLENTTLRIMLLDDEPFMLKLLARILNNQGFTGLTACDNGRDALRSMDEQGASPDLVVLDLNMPQMDGVEFIRHLVERRYEGSLILVSGEDERVIQTVEKLALAHRITVLGFLHKPIKPESLLTLILKWLPASASGQRVENKTYGAEEVNSAISSGELVNFYQPKVSVATGEVVGMETLVRWRHPADGLIFPDQFIGVAEEHGLIDDLTRVVIAGTLDQIRAWKKAGLRLRVSVNVSMDNLVALDFADALAAQVVAAGVTPQDLILEITESRLMGDMKASLDILTRLRLKRFSLSIDDFGTGHSSLTQLRDIPFDELKIDRSFVHGAAENETVRAIYEASLMLAKQLGMEVVAEGVEDHDDWEFLRQTGCDLAQGYFICKPMPAAEVSDWIDAWNIQYRYISTNNTR